MIVVRRAKTLGCLHEGNATLQCHFSFASYHAPQYTHDGRLRVLNTIQLPENITYCIGPESNFDIATWIVSGSLTTACDDFEETTIRPNELHLLSTASGCTSLKWQAITQEAKVIQFWFLQDNEGGEPSQEIWTASIVNDSDGFHILASGFPEDDPEQRDDISDGGPAALRTSSRLLYAKLLRSEAARYETTIDRILYLVVIRGTITLNDIQLNAGDAAHVAGQQNIIVHAEQDSIIMMSDTTNS